jgi:hypothetical protein
MNGGQPGTITLSARTVVGLIGVGLIVVGSVGPWVSSPFGSVSGIHGDGKWTLILAIPAAAAVLRHARIFTAIMGLAIGATAVYDGTHISQRIHKFTVGGVQIADVGWGVWLVGIGGGVLIAAAFGAKSVYGPHMEELPRRGLIAAREEEAATREAEGKELWDATAELRAAEEQDTGWWCDRCGGETKPGDKFCPHCGVKFQSKYVSDVPPDS